MRRYAWSVLVPTLFLLAPRVSITADVAQPSHNPYGENAFLGSTSAVASGVEVPEPSIEGANDFLILREKQSDLQISEPQKVDPSYNHVPIVGGQNNIPIVKETVPSTPTSRNASSARQWGSHPLPPLKYFIASRGDDDIRWTAYFYDQAIAIIQQTQDGTVLNCTLQEVIQVWEQREAQAYLGQVMPLVPIPFQHMVHLVTLCGTFTPYQPHPHAAPQNIDNKLWWLDTSALQGILPGTLWCGMGDQAETYHDLGSRRSLDSCCRAHDHCPIKLRPMMTRYGLTNYGLKTMSHCSCDLEFFRCLKAAGGSVPTMVGQVYFNFLKMDCLDSPRSSASAGTIVLPVPLNTSPAAQENRARLSCLRRDQDGMCRFWLPNPKGFTTRLQITKTPLEF